MSEAELDDELEAEEVGLDTELTEDASLSSSELLSESELCS